IFLTSCDKMASLGGQGGSTSSPQSSAPGGGASFPNCNGVGGNGNGGPSNAPFAFPPPPVPRGNAGGSSSSTTPTATPTPTPTTTPTTTASETTTSTDTTASCTAGYYASGGIAPQQIIRVNASELQAYFPGYYQDGSCNRTLLVLWAKNDGNGWSPPSPF